MKTPAFVIDVSKCIARLEQFADLRQKTHFKLLYSIKSLSEPELLQHMLPHLDGFCVSSLYESQLAREVISQHTPDQRHEVHLSTPGIREEQLPVLCRACDVINLNSETQRTRFTNSLIGQVEIGLRLNPQRSFLTDDRYDPCRRSSKLGVIFDRVESFTGLNGVHFHTMYNGKTVAPLIETVKLIENRFDKDLAQLDWINLGGGYVFTQAEQINEFENLVCRLVEQYDLTVYFEPGKGIVDHAGKMITKVIDLFERDGKFIVILDTSVVHLPEIFEYQQAPKIKDAKLDGQWPCVVAGCSCKSGDVFGEYGFDQPLEIGSEIVIENVGAYSIVKASRFNGIELPEVVIN